MDSHKQFLKWLDTCFLDLWRAFSGDYHDFESFWVSVSHTHVSTQLSILYFMGRKKPNVFLKIMDNACMSGKFCHNLQFVKIQKIVRGYEWLGLVSIL